MGDRVAAGVGIGTVQNRAKGVPEMQNHIHIEIKKDGKWLDPAPFFKALRTN